MGVVAEWLTVHDNRLPVEGNDDLKKTPRLPFLFGLDLSGTEVTDAGLKELAGLTNLAG